MVRSKPSPSSPKERLDVILVQRGIAETREKAQALIMAGQVLTGDQLLSKPGQKLPIETPIRVRGDLDAYVSRGAYKLLGSLDHFQVSLEGRVCFDIGASTGGFTQVCLERGASRVYALDVGHNQLHWKLRSDPRVISMEGVNIRATSETILPEKVRFVCIDASFISLKLVLPETPKFMEPGSDLIALIKPQHEVGREHVGKGGIVRDPELHTQVQEELAGFAESIGFEVLGLVESSLKGTTGNREFLIHLKLKKSK